MPLITPRYLSDQTDRMALLGRLRFARRVFEAAAPNIYARAGENAPLRRGFRLSLTTLTRPNGTATSIATNGVHNRRTDMRASFTHGEPADAANYLISPNRGLRNWSGQSSRSEPAPSNHRRRQDW
jgi:hypothetical protein